MRLSKFILLLTALLIVISCNERMNTCGSGSGYGSIVLNLGTEDGLSLKTKTEDDEKAKGCVFTNVLVVIVDHSNTVAGIKYETTSAVNTKTVQINNLLPGHYTAYAYANIDQTIWQDGTISSQEGGLEVGQSFSTFLDRELLSMSNTAVPENPTSTSLLLLTGYKNIEVEATGISTETLELRRPVVRFKVTINNTTNYPVTVNDLSFSHFNPDRAYLLEHDSNGDGVPDVPAGTVYRELPAYDTGTPQTVATKAEGIVYSTYLYENASSNDYRIYATLTLVRGGENNIRLSLGGRPLRVIDINTLNAMADGESYDVLLISPRNTTRAGRLYYGIGDDGLAWESCGYSSFAGFRARAKAIYTEESSFEYAGLSGLAGWSGNNKDEPLKEEDNNTHTIHFDYTGATNEYFHSLTKNGNLFTLDGLSVNPPTDTSISGMRAIKGTYDQTRFPEGVKDYLVEFRNSENKALKSDFAYGETDEDKAKHCSLRWENNNESKHDHQFVLFGKFDGNGGLLKRILKDSNEEVPLTYMSRNEDINVIINVFYAEQDVILNFEVDNSSWTDDAAITPSHYFK